MTGFTDQTFKILRALEANNTREWYEENKDSLKEHARLPFSGMLSVTTALLDGSRYPLIGNDKTMFRQNRDVRFSKDKTLYKTHVSGLLTRSGTKKDISGVAYGEVGPRGGRIAAGFYQLSTAELNKIRDRMIIDEGTFTEIVEILEEKGYALNPENTLKTMPRGFKEHDDHPLAALLKLKSFTVTAQQPKDVWISGDIVERLVHLAETIGPLNAWIRDALTYENR